MLEGIFAPGVHLRNGPVKGQIGEMATNVLVFCHPSAYWLILRTDATFAFAAGIAHEQTLLELIYFPWSFWLIARWLIHGVRDEEA